MNILVDIDGTVFDWQQKFCDWLYVNDHTQVIMDANEIHTYYLGTALGLRNVEALIKEYARESWFRNSAPAFDCEKWIHKLRDEKHCITFMTLKPAVIGLENEIRRWLWRYFQLSELILYQDVVVELPRVSWNCMMSDMLVDDNPKNVLLAAAVGCNAVLLDRPWNQTNIERANLELHGRIWRLSSWEEVYLLVHKLIAENVGKHWKSYPSHAKGEV